MTMCKKIRRIDFSPDEFLVGTSAMTNQQVGVYWRLCALIYSRGGPIVDDAKELPKLLHTDVRTWRRLRGELVAMGKLVVDGQFLTNRRCESELAHAQIRTEKARANGVRGGRPVKDQADLGPIYPESVAEVSGKCPGSAPEVLEHLDAKSNGNNGLPEPGGCGGGKLTINHQPSTNITPIVPVDEQSGSAGIAIAEPQAHPTSGAKPAPTKPAKAYAFHGAVIKLNQEDFDTWKALYHAIPDLPAELSTLDNWIKGQDGSKQKKWYQSISGSLNRKHQEILLNHPQKQQPKNRPQAKDWVIHGQI